MSDLSLLNNLPGLSGNITATCGFVRRTVRSAALSGNPIHLVQ